jgi:hypothetical protein
MDDVPHPILPSDDANMGVGRLAVHAGDEVADGFPAASEQQVTGMEQVDDAAKFRGMGRTLQFR